MHLALRQSANVFVGRRNVLPGALCSYGELLIIDGEHGAGDRLSTELACLTADLSVLWVKPVGPCRLIGVWGAIAVLCGGEVSGFDLNKRRTAWKLRGLKTWRATSGRVFVSRSGDQRWSEVDCATGQCGPEFSLGGIPEAVVGDICLSTSPARIERDGSVHSSGMYTAFDIERRQVVWRKNLKPWPESTRAIGLHESSLPGQCIGVGATEALIAAFAVSDGEMLWKAAVQVPYSSPLVSQGRIPVVSHGDRFCVIDERTGNLLVDRTQYTGMVHQKTGSMWGPDIVAFPAESGHIAVFRVSTGELLALEQTKRSLWSSAVVGDRLMVAASTGEVLAYTLEEGLAGRDEAEPPAREAKSRVDFAAVLRILRSAKGRRKVAKGTQPPDEK